MQGERAQEKVAHPDGRVPRHGGRTVAGDEHQLLEPRRCSGDLAELGRGEVAGVDEDEDLECRHLGERAGEVGAAVAVKREDELLELDRRALLRTRA